MPWMKPNGEVQRLPISRTEKFSVAKYTMLSSIMSFASLGGSLTTPERQAPSHQMGQRQRGNNRGEWPESGSSIARL